MDVFDTIFRACYEQALVISQLENEENITFLENFCKEMTLITIENHRLTRVLDFEQIAPVLPAWWINGVLFVLIVSVTAVLSCLSIHIFLDTAMRSPTNILLTAITFLDILTCLFLAPVNIHAYLQEGYRELPSSSWCDIFNYVHNFLPSSCHSASVLLNMYLSVQRCVGVKDIRSCQAVGTYKGTTIAIIACTLLSFAIHAMYPITITTEEVTAISKKVLSPSGIRFSQSCRIMPRFPYKYESTFSSYLWLRVSMLQLVPALVLFVCNMSLIQSSYKTYIYRKRLVGAVGTITDSTPRSGTEKSCATGFKSVPRNPQVGFLVPSSDRDPHKNKGRTHCFGRVSPCRSSTVSTTVDEEENRRRSNNISVIMCPINDNSTKKTERSVSENTYFYEKRANTECTCLYNMSLPETGKVASITLGTITTADMPVGMTMCPDHTEQGREMLILASLQETVKLSYYSHQLTRDSEHRPSYLIEDITDEIIDNFTCEGNFHHRNHHSDSQHDENGNMSAENNNRKTIDNSSDTQRKSEPFLHLRHDHTRWETEHVPRSDTIPKQEETTGNGKGHDGLGPDGLDKSSVINRCPPSVCSMPESTVQLTILSNVCPRKNLQPDSSKSHRHQLFRKLSVHPSSAEVRSSIMLILVTSCTLVAEIFVIILLIFDILLTRVPSNDKFVSTSDLACLIMISNMLMTIILPLNFIFFCGLSQAFRSALKVRFNVMMRRSKRNVVQTWKQ